MVFEYNQLKAKGLIPDNFQAYGKDWIDTRIKRLAHPSDLKQNQHPTWKHINQFYQKTDAELQKGMEWMNKMLGTSFKRVPRPLTGNDVKDVMLRVQGMLMDSLIAGRPIPVIRNRFQPALNLLWASPKSGFEASRLSLKHREIYNKIANKFQDDLLAAQAQAASGGECVEKARISSGWSAYISSDIANRKYSLVWQYLEARNVYYDDMSGVFRSRDKSNRVVDIFAPKQSAEELKAIRRAREIGIHRVNWWYSSIASNAMSQKSIAKPFLFFTKWQLNWTSAVGASAAEAIKTKNYRNFLRWAMLFLSGVGGAMAAGANKYASWLGGPPAFDTAVDLSETISAAGKLTSKDSDKALGRMFDMVMFYTLMHKKKFLGYKQMMQEFAPELSDAISQIDYDDSGKDWSKWVQ